MNNSILTSARLLITLMLAISLSACSMMYQEPSSANGKGGVAKIYAENPFFSTKSSRIKNIDGKIASLFNPLGPIMNYNLTPGSHQITVESEFNKEWYAKYISVVTLHINAKANYTYIVKTQLNGDVFSVWIVDQNGSTASNVVNDTSYNSRGIKPADISYMNQIANIH